MAIYLCGLPGGGFRRTGRPCLRFDLAPDGVYPAATVACSTGALLPHRFTLTCAPGGAIGGLLSVALACVSPRLAVSQHPFPLEPRPSSALVTLGRDHPADSPPTSVPENYETRPQM